jgi:Ni/Co efflux regulator RcnB
VKKLLPFALLALLAVPTVRAQHDGGTVRAEDDGGDDNPHHSDHDRDYDRDHDRDRDHRISASEMATFGTAAAAAIGIAGFLFLRRRKTQTH